MISMGYDSISGFFRGEICRGVYVMLTKTGAFAFEDTSEVSRTARIISRIGKAMSIKIPWYYSLLVYWFR